MSGERFSAAERLLILFPWESYMVSAASGLNTHGACSALLFVSFTLRDGADHRDRHEGVKQNFRSEFPVSCHSVWLKWFRNALKLYETTGTGAECSGEKRQKSTAIQVHPGHLCHRFQCTHHPPRARSTIATLYGSESANQVQFIQFYTQTGRDICSVQCAATEVFFRDWSVRRGDFSVFRG
ncbi:hypothetical protein MalM14_36330 [Gimesia chilikensis]|nr:hypothetical protein MalM14_36330 [Gimesia chilikensis]